jgi:hypothetical protein
LDSQHADRHRHPRVIPASGFDQCRGC